MNLCEKRETSAKACSRSCSPNKTIGGKLRKRFVAGVLEHSVAFSAACVVRRYISDDIRMSINISAMADDALTLEALLGLPELSVVLNASIANNSAFSSCLVDERPARDQLYDSLEQWSSDRFSSYYRMTKREMR